jgi:hypothetical protein
VSAREAHAEGAGWEIALPRKSSSGYWDPCQFK